MKINLFGTLSLFCLLAGPFCFAQTRPTTQTATMGSPTTPSPRRQQDLYDQYNGVSKKPGQTAAPGSPNTSGRFGGNAPQASAGTQPAKAISEGNTSGFRVGIRGGVTKSFFLEKRPFTESTIGFVGGLSFQLGAGAISFQPEINYSRSSANTLAGSLKLAGSIDQIQVPLFLKLATGNVDGTRLFLNIGPYAAYNYSSTVAGVTYKLDGTDGRLSYGGAAGVGVMVKAGPGQVTLEGRGYYQLGDNNKPSSGDSKTILAQATIGYMIPIGGR